MVMRSRETEGGVRPNASKKARSAPRPPSGLPEDDGNCPNCASTFQGGRKTTNIHASSGVIWGIPVTFYQQRISIMVTRMPGDRLWWTSPLLWLVLALATTIPFFIVDIPPLTDLPNHMARYYVFLNIDNSPFLQDYYSVHWYFIGNLGVDIIVKVIGPVLGAELATRVAVGIIPPLTVAGIYSVSRALNRQVAPSALVALPLAYNWPLNNGFVNFSLSAAMALLVLALWIRMRAWGFVVRALIFAPLGFATLVAHTAGWGLLGLAVFGFEVGRAYQQRGVNLRSLLEAVLATFPFALMILFTLLWRNGTSSPMGIAFAPDILWSKFVSLVSIFRERYALWDVGCTLLFLALTIASYFAGERRVVVSGILIAILYALAFMLCPDTLFSSNFADRRLLPYAAIFVPLSVGVADQVLTNEQRRRILSLVATGAIVFFAARLAVTTTVWERLDRLFDRHLALLEQIPRHSRVFGLSVDSCDWAWSSVGAMNSLQQFALIRRESFVNGLFQFSGYNLEVGYRKLDGSNASMLATVRSDACPVSYIPETLQTAIARFPHNRFDYVWLLALDPLPTFDIRGLRLIGSSGNDRLYQIAAE